MKISTMIDRLREVQERYGDLDMAVGEASGTLHSRLDIAAQPDADQTMICIVQAYVIREDTRWIGDPDSGYLLAT